MATLHVRNVPEALYEALRARAQSCGRSIGNEAIAILAENVARFPHGSFALGQGLRSPALPAPRERVGEPAAHVLAAASREAHALGHDHVETEHVLLALLGEGSVAASLEASGVSTDDVRQAIAAHVARGESVEPGARPFGPGAKRLLELALRESLAQGEGVIAPEHLLLALAGDERAVAGEVLRELGADVEQLRGASILRRATAGRPDPGDEYRAVALTGSADEWTEQLNAQAEEGWSLLEIVLEGGERRAVLRRQRQ
jgi:Antitoxin FitA-like, ribbon-helix-helix/Clp amino terminal domain, pathogenicity island component